MTASTAKSGFSSTLSRDGNVIAELTKIGGVSVSAGEILKTHLTSDYGYVESMQGLRDAGDMPLEGNFIPGDTAGQIGLLTDFDAGTAVTYVANLPTVGATLTFTAWVKAFAATGEITPEGALIFKATLRITGKPVLAITASNNITALVVTTATLAPAFAATTYSYVAAAVAATSVTMTATFAAGVATLTSGTAVQTLTTTVASAAIPLAVGINVVTISVVETGKTAKTYTIWVTRTS